VQGALRQVMLKTVPTPEERAKMMDEIKTVEMGIVAAHPEATTNGNILGALGYVSEPVSQTNSEALQNKVASPNSLS